MDANRKTLLTWSIIAIVLAVVGVVLALRPEGAWFTIAGGCLLLVAAAGAAEKSMLVMRALGVRVFGADRS